MQGEINPDAGQEFKGYVTHKLRFDFIKKNFLQLQQCKLNQESLQSQLEVTLQEQLELIPVEPETARPKF